jgi:hypothetical protein
VSCVDCIRERSREVFLVSWSSSCGLILRSTVVLLLTVSIKHRNSSMAGRVLSTL